MVGEFFPATLWEVKLPPILSSADGYLHQLDRGWRFETRRVSKMQKGLFLSARQTRRPQNRVAFCQWFESRTTEFLTAPRLGKVQKGIVADYERLVYLHQFFRGRRKFSEFRLKPV